MNHKASVTFNAQYRTYRPEWKKWEPQYVELKLKERTEYTLNKLKRMVSKKLKSKKLNINVEDINLYNHDGGDTWELLGDGANDTKYTASKHGKGIFNAIDIKIPIKIRYFHGMNSMYDMIENKNYTHYELNVFRQDKLFDAIDENITKGEVGVIDLICNTDLAAMKFGFYVGDKDEFYEKLVKGYIRSMDFKIVIYDDIIQSIITYRRITKNVDMNQTIYESELYPNCRLTLYKSYNRVYFS